MLHFFVTYENILRKVAKTRRADEAHGINGKGKDGRWKETVEVTAEQQFDAYAIIASDESTRRYRDFLTCLLNEDEMYTEATLIRF